MLPERPTGFAQHRAARGLSLAEVCWRSGLTVTQAWGIETGRIRPSPEELAGWWRAVEGGWGE
jgi:transcriptional regulator with XRE-family HTH domain